MICSKLSLRKAFNIFLVIAVIGIGVYLYLTKSFGVIFQSDNNQSATDTGNLLRKSGKNITAEEKMKDYLDLDMKGEIKSESDELMIIDSYRIINSDIKDNEASFTVAYECVAGGYEFDADGKPVGVKDCASYFSENLDEEKANDTKVDQKSNEETVTFNLKKDEDGWKVVAPALPAHVSAETFLEHTKELLGDSSDIDAFNDFFKK